MTLEARSDPVCPSCGRPPVASRVASAIPSSETQAPGAAILGGIPTPAEIEFAERPFAERAPRRDALGEGSLRCASCGETLYRRRRELFLHRGAAPVLTMAMAADRLRNHLRRLAIVRLGRIEGDCYMLPFFRMEGTTPEGDTTFTLLAASIGEERLERAFLPPADIRPWAPPPDGSAGRSGEGQAALRIVPPTLMQAHLGLRAKASGWSVARVVELIHYPFWLMKVDDCGRTEGAWIDGIEGKLIHHRMRLSPPLPPRWRGAAATAVPALAGSAAVLLAPGHALGWTAAIWAAGVPLISAAVLRRFRG